MRRGRSEYLGTAKTTTRYERPLERIPCFVSQDLLLAFLIHDIFILHRSPCKAL